MTCLRNRLKTKGFSVEAIKFASQNVRDILSIHKGLPCCTYIDKNGLFSCEHFKTPLTEKEYNKQRENCLKLIEGKIK